MIDKPVVTVTRRLTASVEEYLSTLFDARFNKNDKPLSESDLLKAMQESDALLCSITDSINARLINAENRRASIVANFGVGYNNIDIDTAKQKGVVVSNTPDVLTDATADIAMLLILSVTRGASNAENMLRQGDWHGFSIADNLGVSIQNKTLGVIGMGRIGRALARRAVRGFGMKAIYYNRSEVTGLGFNASGYGSISDVMEHADVISLHIPGALGQSPVITRELIAKMKPSSFLINTARGDVVDESALIHALKTGQIAGAGLDVYQQEPHVPDTLQALGNVTLLPHIGSATQEVRDAMGMMAAANIAAHFGDKNYPSRVV